MHCLEEVGGQLKVLKIQCSGFDLSDIAVLCPLLRCCGYYRMKINEPAYNLTQSYLRFASFLIRSLIIQKESPNTVVNPLRTSRSRIFGQLKHVEVSCPQVAQFLD